MQLNRHIEPGPIAVYLNSDDQIIEGSLLSFDEHGLTVDTEAFGSLTYFPWTSVAKIEFTERKLSESSGITVV